MLCALPDGETPNVTLTFNGLPSTPSGFTLSGTVRKAGKRLTLTVRWEQSYNYVDEKVVAFYSDPIISERQSRMLFYLLKDDVLHMLKVETDYDVKLHTGNDASIIAHRIETEPLDKFEKGIALVLTKTKCWAILEMVSGGSKFTCRNEGKSGLCGKNGLPKNGETTPPVAMVSFRAYPNGNENAKFTFKGTFYQIVGQLPDCEG